MLYAHDILSILEPAAPYSWLDSVTRRGLVKPSIAEATGHGSRRRYNDEDALALTVIWRLAVAKMPTGVQRTVADYLQSFPSFPTAGTVLVTDGETATFTTTSRISSLSAAKGILVVIPIVQLRTQVQHNLEHLLASRNTSREER